MYRPDSSVTPEFMERYPEAAKIFTAWKTENYVQDLRKMEEIIDFLRAKYMILTKKESEAWAKLKRKNAKREKLKNKLDGFSNFGGVPWSFQNKEN